MLDTGIQMGEFAQGITHHVVATTGQVFPVFVGFAAHGGDFEAQHDAQLGQQATDAVDEGGALFHVALANVLGADGQSR